MSKKKTKTVFLREKIEVPEKKKLVLLQGTLYGHSSINDVNNGDVLYEADWDSIQTEIDNQLAFRNRLLNDLYSSPPIDETSTKAVRVDVFTDSFYNPDMVETSTNLTHLDITGIKQYYSDSGTYTFETIDLPVSNTVNSAFAQVAYEVFKVYDECDDSSLDTGLWTATGSVTEDSQGIILDSDNEAVISDTDFSTDECVVVGFYLFAQGAGDAAANTYLQLSDGSTHETIAIASSTLSGDSGGVYGEARIYPYDWANKKVLVNTVFYHSYNRIDSGRGHQQIVHNRWTLYTLTGYSALNVRMLLTETNSSSTKGVLHYLRRSKASAGSQPTISLTADGSNYDTVSNGEPVDISNTGTTLALKITGTIDTDEVFVLKSIAFGRVS